jgi:LacI family transcriptional regulator
VALFGVDDELQCRLATPPISNVMLPGQRVGYEAARLLHRLLCGKRPADRKVFLPAVRVVTRQSTDALATSDAIVRAALQYIRGHATNEIMVSTVVREIAASRRELERHFRQGLGNRTLMPGDEVGRKTGEVTCRERPGGLLRYYYRAVA